MIVERVMPEAPPEHQVKMKLLVWTMVMAIMICMVAIVFEAASLVSDNDEISILHQVVRDGTWVDSSANYKLLPKKHFWNKP